MTDIDRSVEFIMATQSAMADSMATQSKTLADMAKTLMHISVEQAKMGERIVTIFEDNKGRDGEMSRLRMRTRNLENASSINHFVRDFAPKYVAALATTAVACVTGTYYFIENFVK